MVRSRCCTPTPPNQCPYQISTFYTPRFPRYSPDKILQVEVTTVRSKVKSRSDHDVAHLHLLTNVPTRYQLPTPYHFQAIAWTIFYRSRSHTTARSKDKSRSGHDFAHLHPLTKCPYQASASYTLWFLRYSPDKLFPRHPLAHPDTIGENNTPTALKGCWVQKIIEKDPSPILTQGNLPVA